MDVTKRTRRKEYKGKWPYCGHSTPNFGCWIRSKTISSDCHFKVQDSIENAELIRGQSEDSLFLKVLTSALPIALATEHKMVSIF